MATATFKLFRQVAGRPYFAEVSVGFGGGSPDPLDGVPSAWACAARAGVSESVQRLHHDSTPVEVVGVRGTHVDTTPEFVRAVACLAVARLLGLEDQIELVHGEAGWQIRYR